MGEAAVAQDFRSELRQAQSDLRDAKVSLAGATRALQRTQASVKTAQREVALLSEVESEAQAYIAQQQARAVAAGSDVLDEIELPTEMQQRRIRYASAGRRLDGLKAALGQLERQHADAQRAGEEHEIKVKVQAMSIIAAWGEIRVRGLMRSMQEFLTLYRELSSLSGLHTTLGQRPVNIPWSAQFRTALDFAAAARSQLGIKADQHLPPLRDCPDFGALLRALEEDADTALPE